MWLSEVAVADSSALWSHNGPRADLERETNPSQYTQTPTTYFSIRADDRDDAAISFYRPHRNLDKRPPHAGAPQHSCGTWCTQSSPEVEPRKVMFACALCA